MQYLECSDISGTRFSAWAISPSIRLTFSLLLQAVVLFGPNDHITHGKVNDFCRFLH